MLKKQYVITAVTLGLIGAVSAGLIGVINLVTRDQIAQNEIEKVNKGIKEIYGKSALISKENDISGMDFSVALDGFKSQFIVNFSTSYEVSSDETLCGYAVRATGSNDYGKISLIVGVELNTYKFKGLYEIINEQTYASTLEDKYLIPVNEGERDIDDVKCGATYGAKLVREIILKSELVIKAIYEE